MKTCIQGVGNWKYSEVRSRNFIKRMNFISLERVLSLLLTFASPKSAILTTPFQDEQHSEASNHNEQP